MRRAELICVANRTRWNIHSVGGQWLSGGDIKGSDVFDGLVEAVATQLGRGGPGKADDAAVHALFAGHGHPWVIEAALRSLAAPDVCLLERLGRESYRYRFGVVRFEGRP